MEAAIKGIPKSEKEKRRLYTQRLFNRLMFLRFIEKKGWLTYNGNREYLRTLFDATEASETDENFLNDRLFWAFFRGLGNVTNLLEESAEVVERRGNVPFLNGGLFEMHDEYDQRNAVHIPNDKFAEILKLFERYNFTVTESTPLDIEVAVDPEMLGKVFEELVTGRHGTGSYYTPRPVVSFMCRESLKICLQNKTDETEECLGKFVDDDDATEIRDPEKVLKVLQTLRICDPACGSGAYLLGMMSELLRLREALFRSQNVDPRTTYQRKLDIIQQNLYGVDKDEFAVNIAMLRLWLSLAVDYEDEVPEPLPNLDYKVATGDSLTGPAPENMSLANPLIQEIQEYQAEYLVTHVDAEKQELREVIAELKANLQGWQANADQFVWQIEFPEVFQEGGFDMVIGNPPYVRHELIRPIKPTLKKLFPEVYTSTADLYVYFYKRGTELLRVSGVLTYISSNKFFRVGYGERLREFFSNRMCLHILLDFGSVSVFGASVDTCIVLIENSDPNGEAFSTATFRDEADILRLSEVFQERAFSMHARDLSPDGWTLTSSEVIRLLERLENIGTPLGEYVDGFYRGVVTGCNDAFIISESIRQQLIAEDARSDELIKPLLRGRHLRKWKAKAGDYLIFTRRGIDIEHYPAIKRYLNQYRLDLEPKKSRGQKRGRKIGNYKWYEIQDNTAYYTKFEKSKIIYRRIAKSLDASYDTTGTFGLDTTFFIPANDLPLLAILNSQLFDWYARHKVLPLNDPWAGGGLQFFAQYMEKVPIADMTSEQKMALSRLVKQILADSQSDDVREIEREIDELVYQLYGLTDAEIELIKQTYRDAGMEI